MCGRMNITDDAYVVKLLDSLGVNFEIEPKYNIAPGEFVQAILEVDGERICRPLRWKIRVSKAKDDTRSSQNARGEKLDSWWYKKEFTLQRCIIPASGWYEWHGAKGNRIPTYIKPKNMACAFAGIWASAESSDENGGDKDHSQLLSCATITAESPAAFQGVHHRLPVMLKESQFDNWLDCSFDNIDELLSYVQPHIIDDLEIIPVSSDVNNARNKDTDQCTNPIGDSSIIDAEH